MNAVSPTCTQGAAAIALALWLAGFPSAVGTEWNQWLGGPGRTLSVPRAVNTDRVPVLSERWRRPLGSGFAGISIWGTNAITAMTDGKQDMAILLDSGSGTERWRVPLGRTKKRSEGTPPGPLSTPAINGEASYVQALDGRFVCLDNASGRIRWEINLKRMLKAYEPGYGFASSPLLLEDLVVLLPAGSTEGSAAALDRRTGEVRWKRALGTSTEYASATLAPVDGGFQIVAQLGTKLVGLATADGRLLWQIEDAGGGLWTPSVLGNGRVFFPAAERTRLLEPGTSAARTVWSSPVFEGVMGPVVELQGLLIGHHQRRLTALDANTGEQLWQMPDETDGQLLVLGSWLVFVNDRAGRLEMLAVSRTGAEVRHRQALFQPTRMETPLAFAGDTLYVRTPVELIALRVD